MPNIPLQTSTVKDTEPITSQNIQINISLFSGIIGCIVFLVGVGMAWGSLKIAVQHIGETLKKIEPKIDDLTQKMAVLWQDKIAPSSSPRQLNDFGTKILNESGIKTIIKNKKNELLEKVRNEKATNPYDAEMAIQKIMLDLPNYYPELVNDLKSGAFKNGVDINTVLYAGSIYLRNLIFNDLGFTLDDLDNSPKI